MRISDWSSDVCSSDLRVRIEVIGGRQWNVPRQARTANQFHGLACPERLTPRHDMQMMRRGQAPADRKSVVEGKSVSVRVDLGGRRIIKKKKKKKKRE